MWQSPSRLLRLVQQTLALVLALIVMEGHMGHTHAQDPRLTLHLARWGYQLENVNIDRVHRSPHDLMVVDYSRDGEESAAFTRAEIERMKQKPDGSRRLVLCYLSIGEAEAYRGYWRWYWGGTWYTRPLGWLFAPSWLGAENKQWRGNLAVRYWDPEWQNLIVGRNGALEHILAAGFDGVYLDKVDSSIEDIAKGRPTAKDDMRALVRRIAEIGRAKRPGFLIFPQNGEELLDDEAYVALIDGIAKEDLLFGEFTEKKANPEKAIATRQALLRRVRSAGKPVLAVEYLDDPDTISAARDRLEKFGFLPAFADRKLKTLRYGDLPSTAR